MGNDTNKITYNESKPTKRSSIQKIQLKLALFFPAKYFLIFNSNKSFFRSLLFASAFQCSLIANLNEPFSPNSSIS